jgi:hypothetical protein
MASVNVPLGVPEGALALRLVQKPLSFVMGSINPVLETKSVSDIVLIVHINDHDLLLRGKVRHFLHLASIATVVGEDVHVDVLQPLLRLEKLFYFIVSLHLDFSAGAFLEGRKVHLRV